nr:non-ribosomal peptide synthetase [Streptomyces sp. SID12501]
MSFEQESIWLQDQFSTSLSRYVESWVHRLRGPVDPDAVETALTTIVERQEALRSRLDNSGGTPTQTVISPSRLPLAVRPITPHELDGALIEAVTAEIPLDEPPLLRATLLRLTEDDAVLAVAIHHAVIDGWGINLLDAEFNEAYRAAVEGREPVLPEVPLQFGEYARLQRRDTETNSREHLEHWRTALSDAPAESTFPADRPRPAIPRHRGGEVRFTLDETTGGGIRKLARAQRATPFVVMTAALTALLNRLSGQNDLVVGTPISRRTGTEVKSLIACLTDVMPLRQLVDPAASFKDLIASTKKTVWSAVKHRHIPFLHLVRETVKERRLGRFPIFQVVLTLEDDRSSGLDLPGVESERVYVHSGRSKFDIFLNLVPVDGGYDGYLEYSTDLFDERSAHRLADRFQTLLTDAVTHPEHVLADLRLMSEEERTLLDTWAEGTQPGTPPMAAPPLAHEAVAAQALRTPDAPAVIQGDHILTYRELTERAGRVSSYLAAHGYAGPGQRVALCVGRSFELPATVLGILGAGACCVPVDPAYPADRIAFMLGDSGADVVLTDSSTAGTVPLPDGVRQVRVDRLPPSPEAGCPTAPGVTGEDLAYALYTSGSTGRPKGVAMPHRSLAGLVDWQSRTSTCGPGSRTLQYAPASFDVFFQELFATWAGGGALVMVGDATRRDPQLLLDLVEEQRVERLILPYVALQQFVEYACAEQRRCGALREVITSGEQLFITPSLRRFFSDLTRASLENQYGPTETHVVTAERLSGNPATWPERPPIGRPIDAARVQVLDDGLRSRPIGAVGEICVGGRPVGLGYLGHARQDAERFVADPLTPGLLYRTGDLGRFLPDGRIEFLGRRDGQVKIRGHRVEPGEVEAVAKTLAGVADAVVVAGEAAESTALRLIAFYRPSTPEGVEPDALPAQLREALPAQLVPAACVPLTRFPLTASGKVDRVELVRRVPGALVSSRPPAGRSTMRGATEERLAKIWGELLSLDTATLGAEEGFFDIGGDSLLAARLLLRLREELDVRLGLDAVFNSPTIADLAARIDGRGMSAAQDIAEVRLPADIMVEPHHGQSQTGSPEQLLLTGATGFLGAFLLRELIEQTDATVHCLVRATDADDGRRRLRTSLERYGVWSKAAEKRTVVVVGDLERSRLGLPWQTYDQLAGTVDAVYHCGASVNLAHSYGQLKAANVDGTIEVLRLAAAHRPVPVHHVSTVGVFTDRPGERPITADDQLTSADGLRHGYAQSKWVAERLVEQARARGLTVSVYRPTRISGETETGACQTGDFMWLLLKGCIEARSFPMDLALDFDLVPVDYASAALVALSLDPAAAGSTYHLAGRLVSLAEAVARLRVIGYRIDGVPMGQWIHSIEDAQGNTAFPLLEVMALAMTAGDGDRAGGAVFDATKTEEALRPHSIVCPEVDEDLFHLYVTYYRRTGFLPEPDPEPLD